MIPIFKNSEINDIKKSLRLSLELIEDILDGNSYNISIFHYLKDYNYKITKDEDINIKNLVKYYLYTNDNMMNYWNIEKFFKILLECKSGLFRKKTFLQKVINDYVRYHLLEYYTQLKETDKSIDNIIGEAIMLSEYYYKMFKTDINFTILNEFNMIFKIEELKQNVDKMLLRNERDGNLIMKLTNLYKSCKLSYIKKENIQHYLYTYRKGMTPNEFKSRLILGKLNDYSQMINIVKRIKELTCKHKVVFA
jgi:translation initiation factor 2 beta subunit (eIF-2beta)/eIF-5